MLFMLIENFFPTYTTFDLRAPTIVLEALNLQVIEFLNPIKRKIRQVHHMPYCLYPV